MEEGVRERFKMASSQSMALSGHCRGGGGDWYLLPPPSLSPSPTARFFSQAVLILHGATLAAEEEECYSRHSAVFNEPRNACLPLVFI